MRLSRVGPKQLLAALVLCAALGMFGYTLVQATLLGPQEAELSEAEWGSFVSASPEEYPARLRIAAIGVDAAVQDVGVARSGRMAVPSNYTDAGWYRYGPAPGGVGSAVFDGHVDNGFGRLAVFSRLHELKRGDVVEVEQKSGAVSRFEVSSVEEYAVAEVPLERIFSKSGKPRVALITCEGEFDEQAEEYDRRVVVYAELIAG